MIFVFTIALLVKVSTGVKKATKCQKYTSVSHPLTSPNDICCSFGVGYDPNFIQKKINDVGAENFTKITANVQKR